MVAGDVEEVAKETLKGVQEALEVKKKQYVTSKQLNIKQFSNEVNLVVRFAELICLEHLRTLDLDRVPRVLRADLVMHLGK